MSSLTQVEPFETDLTEIEYLGSGAFSNVVRIGNTGEFKKMPKSAALAKSFDQEAAILEKATKRRRRTQL
jgi:hypothetical protein